MIQGTTSDAGKSVFVAGLCRLYQRNGYKVAPFKPQNMALNSAVAINGGEIGRAQAYQARAAKIAPTTDMNPILLKPTTDIGAQVIVNGKVVGNMQAGYYHDHKPQLMAEVLVAYHRLQQQYDIVFIEGAGSPAEINLRANDIANMGFAEKINCPVLLIADIDRGGVFAHLTGTLNLLAAHEQNLIHGFIINKFRGLYSLLEPGCQWLENYTNKKVVGVLPYLQNFYAEPEDAITTQQNNQQTMINITVITYPKISNHSDFDALRLHPNIDLQFKRAPDGGEDLIILPGSKSVCGDLIWLKQQGWHTHITKHLRYGGKILGICGGYQMLGQAISDPDCIENDNPTEIAGLGLLDIQTILQAEKVLKNVEGVIFNQFTCKGYEIHCGITTGKGLTNPLLKIEQHDGNYNDGAINLDNNVAGCYLHGLFDRPEAQQALLQWSGSNLSAIDSNQLIEESLEQLADSIEENCDITLINQLLGV